MRVVLTVAVFLLAAVPLFAAADDAASVQQKHKAFAGWDASDPRMAAWHLTGSRTHGGATDSFEEFRNGLAFRDIITTKQGIFDETGFTGRYVWHSDANGYWNVVLGREAQATLEWDLVRSEALHAFPAQVTGEANVNGTRCEVVRIQPKGLVAMDLYENLQTGALTRVVVAPGAVGSTTFDDIAYTQTPGGQRIMTGWDVDGSRYSISATHLQAVADRDLIAPGPSATWTYSDAPVPLTLAALTNDDRLIRVTASVNGLTGTFLLGTNTPSIMLFDPYATQAGTENLGTSDFSPYIGNAQFEGYARVRELKIGSSVLSNLIVQKIDAPNSKLAGVLGYDFFAGAVVTVDLAGSRMLIEDPMKANLAIGKSDYAFPVDLTNRVPQITMPLPSGALARPVLDSELSGFMVLSQALYDSGKIGGQPLGHDSSVIFSGVGATGDPIASTEANFLYTAWNGASSSGRCISAQQISVGPYRYENPPICMGGTSIFGDDGGSVGLDFLRHFNWVVDYPQRRVVLAPNGQ